VSIDPALLEVLACPITKGPLRLEGDKLVSERLGVKYPIRDGIPILLIEEAELPEGTESVEKLLEKWEAERLEESA